MADSMNSMSISLSPKTRTDYDNQEESGWTNYFEDFMANNIEDNNSTNSFSSGYYDSMVSDAASSAAAAAKKSVDIDKAECFPMVNTCKKLSFKKRKTKGGLLLDDALEDTASSPVNSPKVSQLNQLMQMRQKEKDEIGICEKKGSGSGQSQTDERSGLGFVGGDTDCTELKKKGLCLVPLSVFVNYLG